MYGKVPANAFESGNVPANAFQSGYAALNPMYGKVPANAFQSGNVPANAMTINVYDIDNVLVRSFTSQVAAAEWLGVSRITVMNYIKSGKVWNNKYTFQKSS